MKVHAYPANRYKYRQSTMSVCMRILPTLQTTVFNWTPFIPPTPHSWQPVSVGPDTEPGTKRRKGARARLLLPAGCRLFQIIRPQQALAEGFRLGDFLGEAVCKSRPWLEGRSGEGLPRHDPIRRSALFLCTNALECAPARPGRVERPRKALDCIREDHAMYPPHAHPLMDGPRVAWPYFGCPASRPLAHHPKVQPRLWLRPLSCCGFEQKNR